MRYTLMHRDIAVADVEIEDVTCGISKVLAVHDIRHLPVGIQHDGQEIDARSLNGWWSGRAIPASRSGIREALAALRVTSTGMLLVKCFGLSLSDQYWMNPAHKPLEWADVNFFNNDFSEDVGNALFGRVSEDTELDLKSPDNTSDGWLKKKWIIADGKRMLMKGGSAPFYQEPLNEVIAAAIMERMDVPHVPYHLVWDGDQPLSVCEDFITAETELVSAWHISQIADRPNHLSTYQHFLDCCERLGIPDMAGSLDRMLTVDFLIANTDRHYNNFGAVRRADALEWIGAAPVFDCGTSFWHNQIPRMIRPRAEQESKPFRSIHSGQIKLVRSFDWLDMVSLKGIGEEFDQLLRQSGYIDDQRRDALVYALESRVELLENVVQEHTRTHGFEQSL